MCTDLCQCFTMAAEETSKKIISQTEEQVSAAGITSLTVRRIYDGAIEIEKQPIKGFHPWWRRERLNGAHDEIKRYRANSDVK